MQVFETKTFVTKSISLNRPKIGIDSYINIQAPTTGKTYNKEKYETLTHLLYHLKQN